MGREPWLIFQGYWDKVYESHWSNTGKPLQKFPQNIGQKCRLNKLLVTEFFMDAKKKGQKVQLSMSLCASASTLYFGKFWYWCIILDHLPNVVYIYTQYTKLSRPSIDPMPILALALILSICGSLHPPVAPTQSIQENQHLHSQLTWC